MQGATVVTRHPDARKKVAAKRALASNASEPAAEEPITPAKAPGEAPASSAGAAAKDKDKDKDAHPGEAKSKATAAAFVGDYTGEDVSTYRIESMPDRTEKDPKARLTVTSSSDTALAFELVDSSNGKEICTLKGTLAEGTATIGKGQKCFEQNGEDASAAATVITGTATVDKTRLVFDLDMSFSMEIADRKLGGSLAYHFDGTRK
jgi:hypothetical protein